MPKELIVSVNGREKKIAILENGRVTEFYIERGEGAQGIVGNIYKGRVMRVLPGMQSAFVDIGLERDAFLYVSDFFDEEEEFERIVIDKKRTDGADADAAARAAAERIEQARLERERQIESAQERAEPVRELPAEEIPIALEAIPTETLEATDETTFETEARSGNRRNRRNRRRERQSRDAAQTEIAPQLDAESGQFFEVTEAIRNDELRADKTHGARRRISPEEVNTPFVEDYSFERVTDDESAVEDGAMLKDAMLQERLTDQIHAVEFDLEDVASVKVGALLTNQANAASGFERISDDETIEQEIQDTRSAQPVVAASVSFSEQVDAPAETLKSAPAFERVSDDEALESAPVVEATTTETSSAKTRGGRRGKRVASETTAEEPATAATSAESEEATAKKRSGRSRAKKSEGETKPASRRRKSQAAAASSETNANEASSDASNENEPYADAEASVSHSPSRGEFARRGGRRRGRSGGSARGANGANGHAEGVDENESIEVEREPIAEVAPVADNRRQSSGGDNNRRGGDRRERRGERGERGGAPTITDLLREGQEVLVQIAKEPISQKGARITSHIALPGRFLVYMPTIEHVGVSRKIESDSERQRLRKLIQNIRQTEEVPSGGFIVRTAGVGISEEDLRDDARYLVRTWRDIRRNAEKQKSPALVHKDLDLVQRILRDQLSDDFTAIRVDSEEEYLAIVEFINRINPRMVNRVKLHTREEPILETYGVQAEIDKAIKPRVWLKSGGYLVINQTEALVAIDVNTGKFVGRGGTRLEDTITRTNLEAVEEIARQIRLRDLGGIIVLDLIDMEERRNRQRVMQALQDALKNDKSPTKVLSFNDFGLVIMTRKRVKQSLERTLCSPCPYCQGAGLVKSPQTVCYEILEEARRLARAQNGERFKQTTLRVNPEVANTLRTTERDVLGEVEDYLGAVDITSDPSAHQEQFDFAFI